MKLVFAQGNPGLDYAKSRHNLGWMIIDEFASQLIGRWLFKSHFNADIFEASINQEKILLVKPHSFYNETGNVIYDLVNYYKLNPSSDILVIHDDLALPLGTIRVRNSGKDAGNRGIKSINTMVGDHYDRLRVGTWAPLRDKTEDSDFVLARFNKDELVQLKKNVIPKTVDLIDDFCNGNLKQTSYKT